MTHDIDQAAELNRQLREMIAATRQAIADLAAIEIFRPPVDQIAESRY